MPDEIVEVPVRRELMCAVPEQVPGEHLWIVMAAWKVDPATLVGGSNVYLDHENLVTMSQLGCYWCEEEYTKRLAFR